MPNYKVYIDTYFTDNILRILVLKGVKGSFFLFDTFAVAFD